MAARANKVLQVSAMGLPRLLSRSLWRATHLSSSSGRSGQPPILHISPLRVSGLALLHSSNNMSSEKKPLGLTDSIMAQKIAETKSEEKQESIKGESESEVQC